MRTREPSTGVTRCGLQWPRKSASVPGAPDMVRERLKGTSPATQRGVLAGFAFKKLSLTGNLFNPDRDKPTFVLSVAVTF